MHFKNFPFFTVLLLIIVPLLYSAPYPQSTLIETVNWDWGTYEDHGAGSDQWVMSWGDDGKIYTAWGDGYGWSESGSKMMMGITTIADNPPGLSGSDIYGISSKNWKPNAYIALSGQKQYMLAGTSADGWNGSYAATSTNNGRSWSYGAKIFDRATDNVIARGYVQFGPGYMGIPPDIDGNYLYLYLRSSDCKHAYMAKIPKSGIFNRSQYTYYNGLDGSGNPIWSSSWSNKKAVHSDPAGSEWGHITCTYNPGLNLYILTKPHNGQKGFGMFESAKPWGPWKTIYYGTLKDSYKKFTFGIPQKWISSNGQTFWLMWSGWPEYDKVCFVKGTFSLGIQDNTPPSTPGSLQAQVLSESSIKLTWTASTDNESGVSQYTVKRDGNTVGTVSDLTYTDTGLSEASEYAYTVVAINGVGLSSSPAGPVSETTLADNTAPAMISVAAAGDPTNVTIVFSEAVEGASAESAANYSIDQNVSVSAATLSTDLKTVTLTTSPLSENVDYTLTVNNVRDRATTPNTITPNSQAAFQYTATLEITNTVAASGKNYVWDELEYPKPVYIDRSYTYSTIPAKYDGLQYLMTANDDKAATGSPLITFDVNQDVTVYVAYAGTTLPGWLANWTDTGDDLVTTDRTFHVYSKDFAQGTVSLGNNGTAPSMYTVVVEKKSGGPVVQVNTLEDRNDLDVQVCPNPFNPGVSIRIQNAEYRRQNVDIRIFNIQGNLINILHSGFCILNSTYKWNASGHASGIYLLKVRAGNRVKTVRLMLNK